MSELTQQDLESTVAAMRTVSAKLDDTQKMASDHRDALKREQEAMNAKLDRYETKNQELMAKIATEEKLKSETADKLDALEKAIGRMGRGNPDYQQKSAGIIALENYVTKYQYNDTIKSYMAAGDNVQAGFLMTPEDTENMIIKKIVPVSPIRQYARVRKVNAMLGATIARNVNVNVFWINEGEPVPESASTYNKILITMQKQMARVSFSYELAMSSMFNLENEIGSDLLIAFAQAEGAAFVNGTGVKQPLGFMSGTTLRRVPSGIANDFSWKSLNSMYGELKTAYQPIYGMHRKTVAHIRSFEDTAGRPIWLEGNWAAGIPSSINGLPYIEIPDMAPYTPATANGEFVILADFARMYEINDGMQLQVIRDPYSGGDQGLIVIRMYRFVGGAVIMPEAGVVLKNAVS